MKQSIIDAIKALKVFNARTLDDMPARTKALVKKRIWMRTGVRLIEQAGWGWYLSRNGQTGPNGERWRLTEQRDIKTAGDALYWARRCSKRDEWSWFSGKLADSPGKAGYDRLYTQLVTK